jgi:hypothetical protein
VQSSPSPFFPFGRQATGSGAAVGQGQGVGGGGAGLAPGPRSREKSRFEDARSRLCSQTHSLANRKPCLKPGAQEKPPSPEL